MKRRGFTLFEVLIAVTVLAMVLVPLVLVYRQWFGNLTFDDQRRNAWRIIANQEALLRQAPYEDVQEGHLTLDSPELPQGRTELDVERASGMNAKSISITVMWQGARPGEMKHLVVVSPFGLEAAP